MELVWKIKVFHVYFSQFQLVLATVAQKRKQLQASVTQCLREFPRNAKIPAGELYLKSIYCFHMVIKILFFCYFKWLQIDQGRILEQQSC